MEGVAGRKVEGEKDREREEEGKWGGEGIERY